MRIIHLVILLLTLNSLVCAQSDQKPQSVVSSKQVDPYDIELDRTYAEFGASLGWPVVINIHAGVWNIAELPVLVRANGMYWSDDNRGVDFDLGWIFDGSGNLKQYLCAVVGTTDISLGFILSTTQWQYNYKGIAYGGIANAFFYKIGLVNASGTKTTTDLFDPPTSSPIDDWRLIFNIGLSFMM